MNRGWAPGYLARWLFSQGEVWITADGRPVEIDAMEWEHALNTLLMIERVAGSIEPEIGGGYVQDTPLYAALRRRVEADEPTALDNPAILPFERRVPPSVALAREFPNTISLRSISQEVNDRIAQGMEPLSAFLTVADGVRLWSGR